MALLPSQQPPLTCWSCHTDSVKRFCVFQSKKDYGLLGSFLVLVPDTMRLNVLLSLSLALSLSGSLPISIAHVPLLPLSVCLAALAVRTLSLADKGYCLRGWHRPSFPFQVGRQQRGETATGGSSPRVDDGNKQENNERMRRVRTTFNQQ